MVLLLEAAQQVHRPPFDEAGWLYVLILILTFILFVLALVSVISARPLTSVLSALTLSSVLCGLIFISVFFTFACWCHHSWKEISRSAQYTQRRASSSVDWENVDRATRMGRKNGGPDQFALWVGGGGDTILPLPICANIRSITTCFWCGVSPIKKFLWPALNWTLSSMYGLALGR